MLKQSILKIYYVLEPKETSHFCVPLYCRFDFLNELTLPSKNFRITCAKLVLGNQSFLSLRLQLRNYWNASLSKAENLTDKENSNEKALTLISFPGVNSKLNRLRTLFRCHPVFNYFTVIFQILRFLPIYPLSSAVHILKWKLYDK